MTVASGTGDKSYNHVEHMEAGDNTPTVRVPVLTQIPVVGHIETGHPTIPDSDIEYFTLLPSSWVDGKTFIICATGDDMTGAGIHNGDLLFVKMTDIAPGGKIVVALLGEGSVIVRRIWTSGEKRMLCADNSTLPPDQNLIIPNDLHIWGVIKKVIHDD